MSFSADLLDGFENLYKRTEGVLKSCNEISDFFKGLSKVEKEYAKALTRLAASQKGDFAKAPAVQKEVGSTFKSWETILTELEKIAEHHNQFGDKLENDLSKNVINYIKEKQKVKKKLETDGKKITLDMKTAYDNLKKSRDKYVQLSKEAESAEAVHTKGKGDMTMKPSALAKLAAKASQCTDRASAADNEYQHTLNATNQKQTEYYTTIMPQLLTEFQQFEEDRIQYMKEMVEKFAALYTEMPTIYSTSSGVISTTASSISIQQDIQAYVQENRTNVKPPQDIPYTTYDSAQPSVPQAKPKPKQPPTTSKYHPAAASSDVLSSKDWGLSSGDQSLPLESKMSKLQTQLEALDKAINSETKAKEGLENLVRFYATDPVAQKKAEDQMNESEDKLNRLRETRSAVQNQLDNLNNGGGHSNSGGGVKAKGIYDYTATCDTELTFKQGDVLTITEQDDSGWWYAELNGKSGFVPNNYVTVI